MKAPKTWQDLPLVEVVWEDAAADLSHEGSLRDPLTAKKFGGMALCRDVGYLIRKNRKEIVLAGALICDEDSYRGSNTIPMNWVREIVYLERPTRKRSNAGSATVEKSKPEPDSTPRRIPADGESE